MKKIYEIFKFLPREIQVALFSAIIPEEVLSLANNLMPLSNLTPLKKEIHLNGTLQYYVAVEEDYKLETLRDLYDSVPIAQSVIFCNTRRKVDWLSEELNKQNHTVSFIHSDMTKGDREKVIATFRSGSTRVLLARGIDVQHVSIVINFDLPANRENYLHRLVGLAAPAVRVSRSTLSRRRTRS